MDDGRTRAALLAEIEGLRKRAELEGQRMLLQQLPVLLWTTDPDFRCTSLAGGALKRLGLDPDQLVGITIYEYFGSENPGSPPLAAHHAALLGEPKSYEFTFAGMTAQCHVKPLYDEDGEIEGVIGIGLDVSERAEAEAERVRLLDELQVALRERRPLGDLVKICARCKSIREAKECWVPLERFLGARTDARFTHGLCPLCVRDSRAGS